MHRLHGLPSVRYGRPGIRFGRQVKFRLIISPHQTPQFRYGQRLHFIGQHGHGPPAGDSLGIPAHFPAHLLIHVACAHFPLTVRLLNTADPPHGIPAQPVQPQGRIDTDLHPEYMPEHKSQQQHRDADDIPVSGKSERGLQSYRILHVTSTSLLRRNSQIRASRISSSLEMLL